MEATAGIGEDEDNKKSKGGGKGGNIMMRIARELGRVQDKFLDLAMKSLDQMKAGADSVGPGESGGAGFMTAQSEFQAYMQLFNMTSQAASTGIKTLGEAAAGLARKQ